MSLQEFKGIVDQFPNLRFVGATGIGSCFLNPDFLAMVRYLKSKSIIVRLIDQFNHVDDNVVRQLVEMEVDILFISMYGATKDTYEQVCMGSDFDKIVRNIRLLAQAKRELKTQSPVINFHYIFSKANVHEMIPFIELVHSLDCNQYEILFTPLLHPFDEVKDLAIEITSELRQRADAKARELGIRLAYNTCTGANKPPIKKCTAWIEPFIFATGHVIPCCVGNEANRREFQKDTSLGNVFEERFEEIWYGENYKRFRQMIHHGEVPAQCANCAIYDVRLTQNGKGTRS